jgi:hypothetical protein
MRKPWRSWLVLVGIGSALAAGLGVAAFASSSGVEAPRAGTTTTETETTEQPTSTRYRSALTALAEVPKPAGVRANAGGTFGLTLTTKGSSYSVKWTLTFRNLTGKAIAAHIHRAKPGKPGPVVLALCGPCRTGRTGSGPVSGAVANAIKGGSAYVNVHTARNKAGELRGQIRKAG